MFLGSRGCCLAHIRVIVMPVHRETTETEGITQFASPNDSTPTMERLSKEGWTVVSVQKEKRYFDRVGWVKGYRIFAQRTVRKHNIPDEDCPP